MNMKINLNFDRFSLRNPIVTSIIRKCIEATLNAEQVRVPCEINVLVTDDSGIRAINLASRGIDKATDVLSFPMFEFEAGALPENWDDYLVDTAEVTNKTGTILPSTGGIGTTIFYVLGSLLVAFSGVVLFAKKRMRGEF